MLEDHVARNAAARARLAEFAARVAAGDPTLPATVGDWTPVTVIGHVAFWDRFVLERWRKADREGKAIPDDLPPGTGQLVNDASSAEWAQLDPRTAERLALASAEAVDAYLETVTPDRLAALEEAGLWRLALRAHHRGIHLDRLAGLDAPER